MTDPPQVAFGVEWRAQKMSDVRLSPRERLVLNAIIELYIATGEPVASQAVARQFADREGLSSTTLRNVMATLGETGLLEQPHTSAGRADGGGLPLLRGADYATGPSGGRRGWGDRRAGRGGIAAERGAPRAD